MRSSVTSNSSSISAFGSHLQGEEEEGEYSGQEGVAKPDMKELHEIAKVQEEVEGVDDLKPRSLRLISTFRAT